MGQSLHKFRQPVVSKSLTTDNLGSTDGGIYGISKAAVHGLTRHAALSAAQAGVRINSISPSYIWSRLIEKRLTERFGSQDLALEELKTCVPLGRMVSAEDVAGSVAFLASDDASMITGSDIPIEGGQLLQP